MFKMIATSDFLTALECSKSFRFQFSPRPLAGLRGPTLKGGGKGERKKRGEGEKERRGREWEGPAPFRKFMDPPLYTIDCKQRMQYLLS